MLECLFSLPDHVLCTVQEIGDCVLMLEGHSGPLKDMAIAANGSVVVTASEDGTARAWDLVRPYPTFRIAISALP